MSDVVPFGKYKGRSVEDLAADKEYSEWLLSQSWFQERFSRLCAVIAAAHTPQETPEHNLMQAEFLKPEICTEVAERVFALYCGDWRRQLNDAHERNLTKHIRGYGYIPEVRIRRIQFESNGADVAFELSGPGFRAGLTGDVDWGPRLPYQFRLELKPSISDDYPAVLRQAIASKCNVVVTKSFSACVKLEDVQAIFNASNIAFLVIC